MERDYRTGKYSLRELETIHGPSAGQISRKAAQFGWTKNLSTAIKQATQDALLHENGPVLHKPDANATKTGNSEHKTDVLLATVLAAAELNKRVILAHRGQIDRLGSVLNKAMSALEHQASDLIERAEALQKSKDSEVVGRPAQADPSHLLLGAQRASATMARLQAMERVAFGLDEKEDAAGAEVSNQPKLSDATRAARIAKLFQMAQAQQAQEGEDQDDDARAA